MEDWHFPLYFAIGEKEGDEDMHVVLHIRNEREFTIAKNIILVHEKLLEDTVKDD